MPCGLRQYEPKDFWRVSLAVHRGMHKNLANALVVLTSAVAAVILSEYADVIRWDLWELFSFGAILTPFTTLVGLLTTFRVNDAFNKYKSGRELVEVFYTKSCEAVMRLTTTLPCNQETEHLVLSARRLMVLGVLLVQKHTHEWKLTSSRSTQEEIDADFLQELRSGLITRQELEQMTRLLTTVSITSKGKAMGKADHFPSKNRPRFAWFLTLRVLWELNAKGVFKTNHYHFQVSQCVHEMERAFDEMITLNQTLLPIHYAMVTRFVALIFLIVLPFAMADDLGILTLPVCFVANLVYLTVDRCASEMENPFGKDETDIDLRKLVRQADKHTASIVGLWLGRPCPNYDVNPGDAKLIRMAEAESRQPAAVVKAGLRGASLVVSEKTGLISKGPAATPPSPQLASQSPTSAEPTKERPSSWGFSDSSC